MNKTPEHILTHNFIPVNREYFLRICEPHLKRTQALTIPIVRTFSMAGKIIRVYFYGQSVFEIFSLALNHHPLVDQEPELTIYAWDDTTTNETPSAPWDEKNFENKHKSDTGFFGVYVGGEESLNFYDSENKVGYFWTHDANQLPGWVTSAPFRTIFHWFLAESNIHLMHGAVVGLNNKSILLTAKSGSGKSTTALACLLSGMDYLADDYVAITQVTDSGKIKPFAHSLYHSAKITESGLDYFPEIREKIWNTDFDTREDKREKALFFLMDYFPDQVKHTATLDALIIPKITGGVTRLVPTSKIQALLAIAPTTLLQLPLAETKKISAFKTIIEQVPCYTLELGPDVRAIPNLMKKFLKDGSLE
jgi:hypothetical protein